jgi:hypothetical protein
VNSGTGLRRNALSHWALTYRYSKQVWILQRRAYPLRRNAVIPVLKVAPAVISHGSLSDSWAPDEVTVHRPPSCSKITGE